MACTVVPQVYKRQYYGATCTSDNRPLLPAVLPQPPATNFVKVEADKKVVTQEVAEDTSQYRKSWVTCWPNTHKHKMQRCWSNSHNCLHGCSYTEIDVSDVDDSPLGNVGISLTL